MRSLLLLLFTFSLASIYAQAPELLSFQAVVRDDADALVANSAVGMRLSVLQGSPSGTAAYVETHAPVTNANGLATVAIGNGTVQSGSLAAIDWTNGPYFLKTETDPNGGTAYSITGTSQLMSVPYALYATASGSSIPGPQGATGAQGPPGPGACEMLRTGDGRAVVITPTTVHGYGLSSTGGSIWSTTALSGTYAGAMASDTNVVVYTNTSGYGYGPSSTGGSIWITTNFSDPPLGAVASSGRVVVYTATAAYGFGRSTTGGSIWSTVNTNGTPLGAFAAGNRIVVYTSSEAYGYGDSSTGGSIWGNTGLDGTPIDSRGTR
jgi:hypothetical protein